MEDFVVESFVENVRAAGIVKRILEVMTEKFAKTLGEMMLEAKRMMSNIKMKINIDMLLDNFEKVVTETDMETEIYIDIY